MRNKNEITHHTSTMKIRLMKEQQHYSVVCCFWAVVPSMSAYDPSVHLTALYRGADTSTGNNQILKFRKGVVIYLGRTKNELCPVTAT